MAVRGAISRMDSTTILLAMLFGSIGVGYFIYGKRQANWIALATGIGLCAFPYFVSSHWLMIGIGAALCVLPFVFRD
jgi:hypothetical protein